MCFILSDLKCYGSSISSSKIHFEVKRKRSNEKKMKISKFSNLQNMFFFSLNPSYFQTS
jgi:hypothetical protein